MVCQLKRHKRERCCQRQAQCQEDGYFHGKRQAIGEKEEASQEKES